MCGIKYFCCFADHRSGVEAKGWTFAYLNTMVVSGKLSSSLTSSSGGAATATTTLKGEGMQIAFVAIPAYRTKHLTNVVIRAMPFVAIVKGNVTDALHHIIGNGSIFFVR